MTSEFTDSEDALFQKYESLFELLDKSNNVVFFTGAGISTAANIPDFRGDKGLNKAPLNIAQMGVSERDLDCKMPTYSHCGISYLIKNFNKFRFVTTSNHDGLHQKSGTPWECSANIFGTAYIEECLKCHTRYIRKVITPALHRNCDNDKCEGKLKKTGVRYGQTVPIGPLKKAEEAACAADLVLVLGSSMTTSPFCNLPTLSKHFVICNRQTTPYDGDADICIHDNVDNFVKRLMGHFAPETSIEFVYTQEFVIRSDDNNIIITTSRYNEPAVFIDDVYLILPDSTMRTFEKRLNGEFILSSSLLLSDVTEYDVVIEFKAGFEVEDQKMRYRVGSEMTGLLEKMVTF